MPLSKIAGVVAGVLKVLSEERLVEGQGPGVCGPDHGVLETVAEDMPAGLDAGAGRGAEGLDVVVGEDDTALGEVVEVGGLGHREGRCLEAHVVVAELRRAAGRVVRHSPDWLGEYQTAFVRREESL